MKQILFLILSVAILSSCSMPRYAAMKSASDPVVAGREAARPAGAQHEVLVASSAEGVVAATVTQTVADAKASAPVLTKSERKALRSELKTAIRKSNAPTRTGALAAAKAAGMDKDLKLAIIFGAIGIVAMLIPGTVFTVIGGIALIIGVVFFVKWIIRQ